MPGCRLVFLGAPGTGKGTQARRLAERFGLTPMSSGDTLRAEIALDTQIGRQAAQYVQSGTLVPDEIVTGVMLEAIRRLPPGQGFILDGFPRTVAQAEALEAGLASRGMRLDAVIDFRIDESLLLQRLVNRRVCSRCGAAYNLVFLPPRVAGICDACGGELVRRADDREEVVATRLRTYELQTAPLIDFFEHRGLLRSVDAARSADEVFCQLVGVIESLDGCG